MGLPESPWYNFYFASKGGTTYGAVACANWKTYSLHQIMWKVHVLTDLEIDAALSYDPDLDLLGPFATTDVDTEALCVRTSIYTPAPFASLFLERDLMPTEAWTCLCGIIIGAGQEVGCRPILDWLGVALTKNVGKNKSTLDLPLPTAPLANRYLILQRHHMLTQHLPGLHPAVQRVQGSLIATHIGEVAV